MFPKFGFFSAHNYATWTKIFLQAENFSTIFRQPKIYKIEWTILPSLPRRWWRLGLHASRYIAGARLPLADADRQRPRGTWGARRRSDPQQEDGARPVETRPQPDARVGRHSESTAWSRRARTAAAATLFARLRHGHCRSVAPVPEYFHCHHTRLIKPLNPSLVTEGGTLALIRANVGIS